VNSELRDTAVMRPVTPEPERIGRAGTLERLVNAWVIVSTTTLLATAACAIIAGGVMVVLLLAGAIRWVAHWAL
jgi:hypothetical protein